MQPRLPLRSSNLLLVSLVVVLLLLYAGGAHAQAASSPAAPRDGAVAEQLAVARAQVADAREFQSNMLTTVYWSLATVAGVALLLAGFSWFVNIRVYDRDKAAFERELKATVTEEAGSLHQLIRSSAEEQRATNEKVILERIATFEARAQASTQERLTSLERAMLKEMSALAKSIEVVKEESLHLQLRLAAIDRAEALHGGVLANALGSSCSMLELALKLADEYIVADTLDRVLSP